VNSFKTALLASSVLTTVGFGASAGTFIESAMAPGGDFPNSPPPPPVTNIDFSMFQTVTGTLLGGHDPADFFTFTGLTAGDDFSITFTNTTPVNQSSFPFIFTADGFMETLAHGQSKTDTGVLSATSLTVGVTNTNPGIANPPPSEGYSVTLSEFPAGIPEPSAAAIFAVGLAGLAVARRKWYH
jgi:hypothetical protein